MTRELLTCQSHLCSGEDQGTDPPGSFAKAHGREESNVGQSSWLHQSQVLLNQSRGLLWWGNCNSGQRKSH